MCAHPVRPYGPGVTSADRTSEPSSGAPAADHPHIQHYEIRVKGHLGARWAPWFDGMNLANEDDGTTVIRGGVVDQAALHGLLQKLRDLGIPLVSLTPVPSDAPTTPRPTPRRNEGN
jgi:hypothetical protein